MTHTLRRPEILAPAGTPAKLRTALHFGADAVYLGLKQFSLRSKAGNFDDDELEWALAYAHDRGRRVYVTVNIQPFDSDFDGIERALRTLEQLGPDAVIVADPGVIALARRVAPRLVLHLSTQASVTNAGAARFWFAQGIERIILARELSLEQLGALARDAGAQLEVFCHGAVCIAYSGRCLLTLYWANRDTRRGECAQACRWRYRAIEDHHRPGQANPIEQDERGTYFFDARDLCALPVLDRLVATGVSSLKIEGRTRSPHYVAGVVDVYRQAVEQLSAGESACFEASKAAYLAELGRVSARPMSTHFLTGEQDLPETYVPDGALRRDRDAYVGEVVASDGSSVEVELTNPVRLGERLEVRDRGMRIEPADTVTESLRRGERLRLRGRFESGPGALVRRAPRE